MPIDHGNLQQPVEMARAAGGSQNDTSAPLGAREPAPVPRIEPLPFDQWPQSLRDSLGQARETILLRGGAANMPATFARHPALFSAWSALMNQLVNHGSLEGRMRELIIMRTAWLSQSPLEWMTHAGPSGEVGITPAEVDQVIVGPSDGRWSDADRSLLRAVDQFYARGDLDDAAWRDLRPIADDRQVMEMMMLISQYRMVAQMVETMRIDLGPDFEGLRVR